MSDRLRSTPLAQSSWRKAQWLVIAPHADDETLGCGALICEAAQAHRLAGVAFLTDGGGSHPCGTSQERLDLVSRRMREARDALRVLAPRMRAPLFLSWPDATPHAQTTDARQSTVHKLAAFCAAMRVDAIAVTGREEPHCDHVAAFEVAMSVAAAASRPIAIFEYVVWAKHRPGAEFKVMRTKPMNLAQRHLALAQHRSQLTPLFGDGFRLPKAMQRMPRSDLLYTRMCR